MIERAHYLLIEEDYMNEQESPFRDIVTKTLAIVGIVAVLLAGMWLAVNTVKMAPRLASSLAAAMVSMTSLFVPGERIEITAPDTVTSDVAFDITWDHINKAKKGAYAFAFTCSGDLYFTSTLSEGGEIITCNTPFTSKDLVGKITLTAHSKSKTAVDTDLIIAFTEAGATKSSAETRVATTVLPKKETVTTTPSTGGNTGVSTKPKTPGSTKTQTYVFTGTSTPSNPNGTVDLRARVLEVGVVDKVTGDFTASTSININARVAVRFVVENIGTKTSGVWAFIAQLPTTPFHSFESAEQIPLAPGDRIEYTIGFDSMEQQRKVQVLINVDPKYRTYDIDRNNNLVRADVFLDVK